MQVIIAYKVNSKKPRYLVENLFQRMKVFRRVPIHDKLSVTLVGFVHIAGIMKWIY